MYFFTTTATTAVVLHPQHRHKQQTPLTMTAIYSTSTLNGESFIFNTTTGEWDMSAMVSTSHPRYQADASDIGRAKQATEGTFLADVELVDDGVNEEASA